MDDDIVQQDPDVLDTWFSSALWPIGTLGWPEETDLLRTFNPSSVLCTAREIITLWVSRMVMFNRYFRKDEDGSGIIPFRDVFIHAMIQDGEGRKMSKSLGNGVDPTDIIRSHGADAMRFTLCHMTTQTQDVRMPVELDPETGHNTSPKFDIGRNFCNKLWNAARFAHAILAESAAADTPPARGEGEAAGDVSRTGTERGSSARGPRLTTHDSLPDRWILSRLAAATTEITGYIADYQYASYAQALYDLLWRDFCDWYLEAIKPTVRSNPRQRSVLKSVLESILRLLHPIAPFITEAIHERLRDIEAGPVPGLALDEPRHDDLICSAGWPRVADEFRDEKAERDFHWVRSLVAAIREVRAQHHVTPKRRIVIHCPNAASLRRITAAGGLVEHLAGASRCTDEASHAGAPFTFESAEWRLSDLADEVDAATEKARLEKHLADLDKSIRTLDGRLNNPGYAEKAPPHMVQQTRDQLAEKRTERRTIEAALERLS